MPDETRRRMSRVRRTIAERMVASWTTVPHVTGHYDADATAFLTTRADLGRAGGAPVPVEALLLRTVVPLLAEHPEFNAYVEGHDVVTYGRYDIGIALDTPAGLLVPVVRNADRLGVAALADEVRRLIGRALARELMPDEMSGATFTISNIGSLGGGHAVSILPPRTSAFLSVGRVRPTVRLGEQGPLEVPMMPFSLTVDHRLIDGGPAMRFANRLIKALEELTVAAAQRPHR